MIGWGSWTRTSAYMIQNHVPYQLGYTPLGWLTGIEPAMTGATILRVYHFTTATKQQIFLRYLLFCRVKFMAVVTGLEPATSRVTDGCSNQLNYTTIFGEGNGIRTRKNRFCRPVA